MYENPDYSSNRILRQRLVIEEYAKNSNKYWESKIPRQTPFQELLDEHNQSKNISR